jgi:transcriptional regulator with XRE-family HTH domain
MNHVNEKNHDMAFSERLLKIIAERASGKPTVFAKMAGISQGSIFNYVEGRIPSPENLTRICETFGVNMNWLLTGKGDPYMLEERDAPASEPRYEYNLPEMGADETAQLNAVLDLAKQVLTSGNPQAADALEKNIRYFAHAVRVEERLTDMEGKLKNVEDFLKSFGLDATGQKGSSNG